MNIEQPIVNRNHSIPWVRTLVFYGLWLILAGTKGWLAGIPTAILSGWLSGKLLPSDGLRWSVIGILEFCSFFLRHSFKAGVDVALVAFRPDMRLNPGFISYPTQLPAGPVRNFCNAINSLMPGSLAVEPDENGHPQYHCLNTEHPVLDDLRELENRLMRINRGDNKGGVAS